MDPRFLESELLLQIFESCRDGIAIADVDGVIFDANDSFLKLIGYTRTKLKSQNIWQLTADRWKYIEADLIKEQLIPNGYTDEYEKEIIRKDGTLVSVSVKMYYLTESKGQRKLIWGTFRDITQNKTRDRLNSQNYQKTKESWEALKRIFDLNPLPMSISEIISGKLIDVNTRFEEEVGYTFEELIGKSTVELRIWQDADTRTRTMEMIREKGWVNNLELLFRRKSGEEFWGLFSAQIVEYKGSAVLLTITAPISDRIKEEREKRKLLEDIQEKQEILDQIIRLNPSAITLSKADGTYLEANDLFLEYVGKTKEEVLGKTPIELGVYYDLTDRARVLEGLRTTGMVRNLEINMKTVEGKIRSILFSARMFESKGEKKILAIGHDISDIKESRERLESLAKELEKSRELFQKLFQLIPSAVVLTDWETRRIVDVNERYLELIQFSRDAVIGKTTPDLHIWDLDPEFRSYVYESLETKNEVASKETVFKASDGTAIPVLYSGRMVTLNGRPHVISVSTNISERKKAEEEAKRLNEEILYNKDLFERMFQLNPAAVSLSDLETGVYRQVNQSYCDLIGYRREQIIGKSSLELGIWQKNIDRKTLLAELKEKGWTGSIEATILHSDGTQRQVLSGNRIFRMNDRQMLLALLIDITEKKKIEAERDEYFAQLEESKELFERVFEMNPDTITISELTTGTYISVNERFTEMLQYPKEDAIGSTSVGLGIWTNEVRSKIVETLSEKGVMRDFDVQLTRKDGSKVDTSFSARVVNLGKSPSLIAITRDITLSKAAAKEKEEQAQRLSMQAKAFLEMTRDPEFVSGSLEAAAKKISKMASETLDCDRASIWIFDKGSDEIWTLIAGWDRAKDSFLESISIQLSDYPDYFEAIKAGRFLDVKDVINDSRTKEFASIYCAPLNITSLLDAPVFLRGRIKGVVCLEHRGNLREWKGYESQFAVTVTEQVTQLLLNAERKEAKEELEKAVTIRTSELASALDNLRKTQDQLILSEKMAALGQLVAGIAHEINNPLGAISALSGELKAYLNSSADRLEKLGTMLSSADPFLIHNLSNFIRCGLESKESQLTREERRIVLKDIKNKLAEIGFENAYDLADRIMDTGLQVALKEFPDLFGDSSNFPLLDFAIEEIQTFKNVNSIRLAVDRTSKIVYALKNYAHIDFGGRKVETDLVENIETVLTIYHNQMKSGVEIELDFPIRPKVPAFPDDLLQVWTNLIYNSLQAMKFKGKIKISIRESNNDVTVSIWDNGPGIPAEVKAKIFDPFFTTKGPGEGSGLGLDISRRIILKHSGRIELDSKPGGTTFKVILPRS
ncbi:PAS domain S-box protein [Leptospira fainei serovar Hurstbridge str. BUT 6]|uniref:histidine kinase n=1 Tax=Leptospira fainei serovar Hurstbridge str. BUT 6 TaxID=1193011 RepID=S3VYF4_9LEPT|nr:PAS domain S-box protein [Leptospira fainei]EPG73157.1 PAS domain S-box protein [Leptospira fainei serovar Hurstbridge str. BUT 6]